MLHGFAARGRNAPAWMLSGTLSALALIAVMLAAGPARAEPPITSPQDALCRAEAKARVFLTPDPRNLGLHEIGRQIYYACMRRLSPRPSGRARPHRRHRRR